jgi:hypothetical protein
MNAVYVEDASLLSERMRHELEIYGNFMKMQQLRDVPDVTAALFLPFDHAYTPHDETVLNKMWLPHPPSPVLSFIMEYFFPGVTAAAQRSLSSRYNSNSVRFTAATRWGGLLNVLVEDDDSNATFGPDVLGQYKVILAPSHHRQQQQLLLEDVIAAAVAGTTIVLDAGILPASDSVGRKKIFFAASGCDIEQDDVLVRAWTWQKSLRPLGTIKNEVFVAKLCALMSSQQLQSNNVEVLITSVGGGRRTPLLLRKRHGNRGGSVITCMIPHMLAATGIAGPCAEAVELAGATAAVVRVSSGSSEQSEFLAYSSSVSSDGGRRNVVLSNNDPLVSWFGDVRIAAVEPGKAWKKCFQRDVDRSHHEQQQLEFRTGTDGEAYLHGVKVPPSGVVLASCSHD